MRTHRTRRGNVLTEALNVIDRMIDESSVRRGDRSRRMMTEADSAEWGKNYRADIVEHTSLPMRRVILDDDGNGRRHFRTDVGKRVSLPVDEDPIYYDDVNELQRKMRRLYGCKRGHWSVYSAVEGELFTWMSVDGDGRVEFTEDDERRYDDGEIEGYYHTVRFLKRSAGGAYAKSAKYVAVFDGATLERETLDGDDYRKEDLTVDAHKPFERIYFESEKGLLLHLQGTCRKDGYDTFGELGLQWNGGGDYAYFWVTADKEGRKPWTRELENRKERGEIPSYIHGVNILVYRNEDGEPTGEPTDF